MPKRAKKAPTNPFGPPMLNEEAIEKLYNEYVDRAGPILVELRTIMRKYNKKLIVETSADGYFDFSLRNITNANRI